MQKTASKQTNDNIARIPLNELRHKWTEAWGMKPHRRISRAMLEKSLEFKLRKIRGEGLSEEQRTRLDRLVTAYKRNPRFFEENLSELKPGVRLAKIYKGEHHNVLVHTDGYEYRDKRYGSLSEIATVITGTRWNGWIFFGLKKRGEKL